MAQISLYINDDLQRKIERIAKLNKTSVSKWVRQKLEEAINNDWPNDYFELFGAITDDSFEEVAE